MAYFNNIYQGRRVLVTGHTGFKGSWLTLWLKHLGAEVAGFSINIPTSPSNFNLLNLENDIHHFLGDIRDKERLSEVMDEFKPEIGDYIAIKSGSEFLKYSKRKLL